MKSLRVELTSGEENLGEVNIRGGILQGDSLSPFLLVVFLLPLTYILRDTAKRCHLIFMDDLKLCASN